MQKTSFTGGGSNANMYDIGSTKYGLDNFLKKLEIQVEEYAPMCAPITSP
jgi:hypothetical protein